jgi:peptidoglycan/LPS O-acetylase OafA/YrhL
VFGTFRFLLAHMVVVSHLWRSISIWAGTYAVFAFFLLSGYLMALVLHATYGFTPRGVGRYLANRALRIYPAYLAALGLAVAVIVLFPNATRSISLLRLPEDWLLWLRSVLILTLQVDPLYSSRLIPPAWSIDIELCFYVALGLGLARSRRIALVWFAASVAYTVYLVAAEATFNDRYANLFAASLPYSAGVLLYHSREWLGRWISGRGHALFAVALFAANASVGPQVWNVFNACFYASVAFTAYAVAALGALRPQDLPPTLRRVDRFLGDLSYPVFLCHWSMAIVIVALGLAHERGGALFLWSLPLVNLCAWCLHRFVERPAESLRVRIRATGTARPRANP